MTPYAEHFRQVNSFKDHYVVQQTVREEYPGKICHARSLSSDSYVTVKVVSKAVLSGNRAAEESFRHEMEILDMLHKNPHICRVIERVKDDHSYYIIREHIKDNSLDQEVFFRGPFKEGVCLRLVDQLLKVLSLLDLQSIVHGDLRPSNILCAQENDRFVVKVIGLNRAKLIDEPEDCLELENDEINIDVLSLGVCLYFMLTGVHPYPHVQHKAPADIQPSTLPRADLSILPTDLSNRARSFLKLCLNTSQGSYADVFDLRSHNWLNDNIRQSKAPFEHQMKIQGNLASFERANGGQMAICAFISNTIASEEERTNLRPIFNSFDTDYDGLLSLEDLTEGMREFAAIQGIEAPELTKIFEVLDTDHDGKIDFQDFVTAAIDIEKLLTSENLKKAFEVFDVRKEGSVTSQDLLVAFRNSEQHQLGGKDVQIWDDMLTVMPLKEPGVMSLAEFKQSMRQMMHLQDSTLLDQNLELRPIDRGSVAQ